MSSQPITSRLAALNVLGLEEDATEQDIVKGYKKAALRTHPDKPTGSAEAFHKVQQAYTFLTEPATTTADATTTFEDLIASLFKGFDLSSAKVTVTNHQTTPKKPRKCRFWNGTHGSCRNGKACKFDHPTKLCSYFNTRVGCKYGDGCHNLHK